jgi:CspA family cold shock protein
MLLWKASKDYSNFFTWFIYFFVLYETISFASRLGFWGKFPLPGWRPETWNNTFWEVNTVAEGTVKWFSEQKGYGFIEQDEGGDIFVHHSEINMSGFKTLSEGDRVSFEVGEGTKGPAAKNVTKL